VGQANGVNSMNAIRIANLVGRGSRATERVSRVYGLSGRQMFWAEKRAEPWVMVRCENYRRDSRIGLATRWARLRLRRLGHQGLKKAKSFVGQVGERKGVAKVIGMKSESASRTPAVIREPRPTNYDLQRPSF
jgi:hypothetical protein